VFLEPNITGWASSLYIELTQEAEYYLVKAGNTTLLNSLISEYESQEPAKGYLLARSVLMLLHIGSLNEACDLQRKYFKAKLDMPKINVASVEVGTSSSDILNFAQLLILVLLRSDLRLFELITSKYRPVLDENLGEVRLANVVV
jgi:Golgi to ER traffic protein 4